MKPHLFKKCSIIIAALTLFTVNQLFSEGLEFQVGTKIKVGPSFVSWDESFIDTFEKTYRKALDTQVKESREAICNYGFSLYLHTVFPVGVGVLLEPGFNFNNGYLLKFTPQNTSGDYCVKLSGSYTTLDLPVKATYTFLRDKFVNLVPKLGLTIHFPIGAMNTSTWWEGPVEYLGYNFTQITQGNQKMGVGLNIGFEVDFNLSEIIILFCDFDYENNFTPIKNVQEKDMFKQNNIMFGFGAKYRIGKHSYIPQNNELLENKVKTLENKIRELENQNTLVKYETELNAFVERNQVQLESNQKFMKLLFGENYDYLRDVFNHYIESNTTSSEKEFIDSYTAKKIKSKDGSNL